MRYVYVCTAFKNLNDGRVRIVTRFGLVEVASEYEAMGKAVSAGRLMFPAASGWTLLDPGVTDCDGPPQDVEQLTATK